MAGRRPDLVFPFFLFIVGVSITLAFARRVEDGSVKRDLYLKVSTPPRSFLASDCFSTAFPYFQLGTIRIAGVLQRIAICYLIASLIFLTTKVRTQFLIAVALLIIYCIVMTRLAAPGYAPAT
jgi:predicted acyltransferase